MLGGFWGGGVWNWDLSALRGPIELGASEVFRFRV